MTVNDEMNTCEEHRQAIAANPFAADADAHIKQCAACQAFLQDMQALDGKIERALSLSVPKISIPELPQLDTANVVTLPRRKFGVPAWFAMAATIMVAAVLGFRMLSSEVNNLSLPDQILAHLDHEPYALRVTNKPVSDNRLARVLPASVSTFDQGDGLITYAQSCTINGNSVPHIVIQGQNGPVTILLMEKEPVSEAQRIAGESVNGVILPVGDGSIAIIGEEGEPLEQIKEKVRNSVTWGA